MRLGNKEIIITITDVKKPDSSKPNVSEEPSVPKTSLDCSQQRMLDFEQAQLESYERFEKLLREIQAECKHVMVNERVVHTSLGGYSRVMRCAICRYTE